MVTLYPLDRTIQWINHYPPDNSRDFGCAYPIDSDLSNLKTTGTKFSFISGFKRAWIKLNYRSITHVSPCKIPPLYSVRIITIIIFKNKEIMTNSLVAFHCRHCYCPFTNLDIIIIESPVVLEHMRYNKVYLLQTTFVPIQDSNMYYPCSLCAS